MSIQVRKRHEYMMQLECEGCGIELSLGNTLNGARIIRTTSRFGGGNAEKENWKSAHMAARKKANTLGWLKWDELSENSCEYPIKCPTCRERELR